jgi:hypothetical protein
MIDITIDCPHCSDGEELEYDHSKAAVRVECQACGVAGPWAFARKGETARDQLDEAATLWNTLFAVKPGEGCPGSEKELSALVESAPIGVPHKRTSR